MGTGQGPKGVIKAGKHTGDKHTHKHFLHHCLYAEGKLQFHLYRVVLSFLCINYYILRLSQSAGTLLLKINQMIINPN